QIPPRTVSDGDKLLRNRVTIFEAAVRKPRPRDVPAADDFVDRLWRPKGALAEAIEGECSPICGKFAELRDLKILGKTFDFQATHKFREVFGKQTPDHKSYNNRHDRPAC